MKRRGKRPCPSALLSGLTEFVGKNGTNAAERMAETEKVKFVVRKAT